LATHRAIHTLIKGVAVNVCIEVKILIQLMDWRPRHLVSMVNLKTITKLTRAKPTRSASNIILRPWPTHACGIIRRAISGSFCTIIIPQLGADIVHKNWRSASHHIVRVQLLDG